MRVVKRARSQNRAVGCDNIPFIGVIIPTGITMLDGHVERVRAHAALARLDASDVRLSRQHLDRGHQQTQH